MFKIDWQVVELFLPRTLKRNVVTIYNDNSEYGGEHFLKISGNWPSYGCGA
jgi:hypothetical protein